MTPPHSPRNRGQAAVRRAMPGPPPAHDQNFGGGPPRLAPSWRRLRARAPRCRPAVWRFSSVYARARANRGSVKGLGPEVTAPFPCLRHIEAAGAGREGRRRVGGRNGSPRCEREFGRENRQVHGARAAASRRAEQSSGPIAAIPCPVVARARVAVGRRGDAGVLAVFRRAAVRGDGDGSPALRSPILSGLRGRAARGSAGGEEGKLWARKKASAPASVDSSPRIEDAAATRAPESATRVFEEDVRGSRVEHSRALFLCGCSR